MILLELSVLYLVVGGACALALHRRAPKYTRGAAVEAITTILLWPLWAPIAWTSDRDSPPTNERIVEVTERVRAALSEGIASAQGSPLAQLLNRESAQRIVNEVERVASRHAELVELLAREDFNGAEAARNLEALERQGASTRVVASARLHLTNVQRLEELARRDMRTLEELAGLVTALRTQLVLARLSGSSAEGVGDIVTELWARIEGLSEANEDPFDPATPYVETPA